MFKNSRYDYTSSSYEWYEYFGYILSILFLTKFLFEGYTSYQDQQSYWSQQQQQQQWDSSANLQSNESLNQDQQNYYGSNNTQTEVSWYSFVFGRICLFELIFCVKFWVKLVLRCVVSLRYSRRRPEKNLRRENLN